MAEIQYASNGKGNLGVTLGAIGTGLGVLAGNGGLAGVLGMRGAADPEEKPVTRYEMGLIQENTLLKANLYADNKYSQQAVWNATQEGLIKSQAEQLAQLYTMTKLVIPNDAVMPGWGAVSIKPAG